MNGPSGPFFYYICFMCKSWFFLFFLFISTSAFAQQTYKGRVEDKSKSTPIAFATIIYFSGSYQNGLVADNLGRFEFEAIRVDSIRVSAVGYQSITVPIGPGAEQIVSLPSWENLLTHVVIGNVENPAVTIMRRVVNNKPRNNYDKNDFSARIYKKSTFIQDIKYTDKTPDSTVQKIKALQQNEVNFLTESVTDYARKNNKEQSVMVASRTAGIRNPIINQFFFLGFPNEMNFYKNEIGMFTISNEGAKKDFGFVSPAADNTLKLYDFQMVDTLINRDDTAYLINFQPKKGSKFNGLKGRIMIGKQGYYIRNVIASPTENFSVNFHIVQSYQKYGNTTMPASLHANLSLFAIAGPQHTTNTLNIRINTIYGSKDLDLPAGGFGFQSFALNKDSISRSGQILESTRADTLTRAELNSYRIIDSIASKQKMEKIINMVPKITIGRLPVGPVDLDLRRIYTRNNLEKNRWGLGLVTNEKL